MKRKFSCNIWYKTRTNINIFLSVPKKGRTSIIVYKPKKKYKQSIKYIFFQQKLFIEKTP